MGPGNARAESVDGVGEAAPEGSEALMSRGDWVPCENWGTSIAVGAGGGFANIVLVQPRQGAGATPTVTQAVEDEADIVVLRVVGQVQISSAAGSTALERIRVGIRDNAGLNAFFAGSFTSGIDANEPFLWCRQQEVPISGTTYSNNMNPRVHPWWSVIDINVKRRLNQSVALFYSVSNPGANAITVVPWLRTYARSVS